MWGSRMFLGRQPCPVRRVGPERSPPQFLDILRASSQYEKEQMLHGDQTGREADFYTVNHECWRAICLRYRKQIARQHSFTF